MRFAGRGLRYIVEWRGQWLALAGWQSGAFKSRHRDRWVGWKRELRYRRLHLIGNNTCFVILSRPGVFAHLASLALAAMTRRLSRDWQAAYGHPVLIAKSFVDPAHFQGTLYQAANWRYLGNTRGFARHNGRYTDPHGEPKRLYVYPLQRNARRRLRDPGPLPAAWEPKGHSERAPSELRSLYEELARVQDFRRAQGRKHPVASVLAVYLLASLANLRGPVAAAEYASKLTQRELQAIGAWKNRKTGRYLPVSKSTLHRVFASVDPSLRAPTLRRLPRPAVSLNSHLTASTPACPPGLSRPPRNSAIPCLNGCFDPAETGPFLRPLHPQASPSDPQHHRSYPGSTVNSERGITLDQILESLKDYCIVICEAGH